MTKAFSETRFKFQDGWFQAAEESFPREGKTTGIMNAGRKEVLRHVQRKVAELIRSLKGKTLFVEGKTRASIPVA